MITGIGISVRKNHKTAVIPQICRVLANGKCHEPDKENNSYDPELVIIPDVFDLFARTGNLFDLFSLTLEPVGKAYVLFTHFQSPDSLYSTNLFKLHSLE